MKFIKDQWLSKIMEKPVWFGKNIYKIKNLTELSKTGFAYLKIPANEDQNIFQLGSLGFKLIETNLIFKLKKEKNRKFKKIDQDRYSYHFISKKDVSFLKTYQEQVCKIAYQSFNFSRFHKDNNINNNLACEIKYRWVKNYFLGKRGDEMIVVKNEHNQIVGFLLLILLSKNLWSIDLIAVSLEHRGKRIATKLISYFLSSLKFDHTKSIIVGTQLENSISINLYEKCGFYYHSANHVYHSHW